MICICDYCGTEKNINDLVEMKKLNKVKITRLCLKCWVKYKLGHEELKIHSVQQS